MPCHYINAFIFRTESQCHLIGAKRLYNQSRDYTWLDGTRFEGFMNIIELEPELSASSPRANFWDSDKQCICVAKKLNTIVARTTDCLKTQPFICQKREGTETIDVARGSPDGLDPN